MNQNAVSVLCEHVLDFLLVTPTLQLSKVHTRSSTEGKDEDDDHSSGYVGNPVAGILHNDSLGLVI